MPEAIDAFLSHVELELGLSHNTVLAYRADLVSFDGFCTGIGISPGVATPETIGSYLRFLQETRDLSIASILRQTACLKMFYRFAVHRGLAKENPTDLLDPPHHRKRLPDVLGRPQINALLASVDPKQRLALRDKAILELFYACGLRASELAELKLEDLHFDLGIIRVFGKGMKERIIPIGAPAMVAIQEYLSVLRPQLIAVKTQRKKAAPNRIFVSRSGGPITRIVLWQFVQPHGPPCGHPRHPPAHHPPHLRHSSPLRRRGFAHRAGAAGPLQRRHHPDLHPRRCRPTSGSPSQTSPEKIALPMGCGLFVMNPTLSFLA